jgi:predicted amidohydrolase
MDVIRTGTTHTQTDNVINRLSSSAKAQSLWVVAGIAEKDGEDLYNTAIVLNPEGVVHARYRKIHLYYPSGEGIFKPGDDLVTFVIKDFRIGLMICYDVRFPELARSLALQGVDLLIVPTAWPFPRVEHWQVLTRARAIENQCYLIGANRIGVDGSASFCGNSRIIDPHGVVVSSASEDQEEVIFAEIHQETTDFIRNRMPVFEHRRPEVYRV